MRPLTNAEPHPHQRFRAARQTVVCALLRALFPPVFLGRPNTELHLRISIQTAAERSLVAVLQGHALLTRALGSTIPCPLVDFDGGFNKFMGAAFKLNGTVKETYGADFGVYFLRQLSISCCTCWNC